MCKPDVDSHPKKKTKAELLGLAFNCSNIQLPKIYMSEHTANCDKFMMT
jgi:hypothetical protein